MRQSVRDLARDAIDVVFLAALLLTLAIVGLF
jgi:hypothetical protein